MGELKKMIRVQSSDVHSIGYECGTLYVRFLNGGLYAYDGVPEDVFEAFLNAPSKGKFVHQRLKGRYRYRKL